MMASSKCLLLPFALVVLLAEAQPPVTTPVFTENYGQAVSSKRCYVYSLFTQHCASVPCSAFRALTNVRTNIASSCSARACFWTIGWPPTRDYTPIHVHVRGWLASLSQCGSVPLEVAPKGEGNRREDLAGCEEDGRRGWRGRSSNGARVDPSSSRTYTLMCARACGLLEEFGKETFCVPLWCKTDNDAPDGWARVCIKALWSNVVIKMCVYETKKSTNTCIMVLLFS